MPLSEHLEKLRHFQKMAQYNSIREASQAIGISQAGLSKALSSLEDVLEAKLFSRTKDGLILTKEGKEVLEGSKKILKESDEIEIRLRVLRTSQFPKKLRIGMYDSIAVYFGPELKKYISAVYPDIHFELTVDTSSSLLERVKNNQLDIVIGVNFDLIAHPTLEFYKLFDDHYSFYIIPDLKDDVASQPLLIHEKATSKNNQTMDIILRTEIKKHGTHNILNFETLKTLTLQGFGIGVLPTQVAKPLVNLGQLVSIYLPRTKHLFGFHTIGFLANENMQKNYKAFTNDLYRLGVRWSKS